MVRAGGKGKGTGGHGEEWFRGRKGLTCSSPLFVLASLAARRNSRELETLEPAAAAVESAPLTLWLRVGARRGAAAAELEVAEPAVAVAGAAP